MTPFQSKVIVLTLYLTKNEAVESSVGSESSFYIYLILGYFAKVKKKKKVTAQSFCADCPLQKKKKKKAFRCNTETKPVHALKKYHKTI